MWPLVMEMMPSNVNGAEGGGGGSGLSKADGALLSDEVLVRFRFFSALWLNGYGGQRYVLCTRIRKVIFFSLWSCILKCNRR